MTENQSNQSSGPSKKSKKSTTERTSQRQTGVTAGTSPPQADSGLAGETRPHETGPSWRGLLWFLMGASAVVVFLATLSEIRYMFDISEGHARSGVNWLGLVSDAAVRVALASAPLIVFLGMSILLVLPRTRNDLWVLLGRQRHSERWFARAHFNAVTRTQALGLVVAAFIACFSWLQDAVTKRAQYSRQLYEEFRTLNGFRWLGNPEFPRHSDHGSCALCSYLLNDNSDPTGSNLANAGEAAVRKSEITSGSSILERADQIRLALNFCETLLHSRNERSLSESEFQALWAGVLERQIYFLEPHLNGNERLRSQLRKLSPLLIRLVSQQ